MLVVFEGIDGSGKTSLSKAFAERMAKISSVLWTCEPSHEGVYGARVRSMLAGKEAPEEPRRMAMLFAMDRLDHIERVIAPALAGGAIVVCDRYVDSNIAYQGAMLPGDPTFPEWIAELNRHALEPDTTIYLSARPDVTRARIASRGGDLELFEKSEPFRSKVVELYDAIGKGFFGRRGVEIRIDTSEMTIEDALSVLTRLV